MLDIKLNKDIRGYQSKNALNLSFKQMAIGSIGVGLAVIAAVRLHGYIPPAFTVPPIVIPFALAGDFGPKIQGMPFRMFLWQWFRFYFLEPKELKFAGNNFLRKETDLIPIEHENKGSETNESETAPTAKKRFLSHSKICTGDHSSAEIMEGRHFSKRKHLQ